MIIIIFHRSSCSTSSTHLHKLFSSAQLLHYYCYFTLTLLTYHYNQWRHPTNTPPIVPSPHSPAASTTSTQLPFPIHFFCRYYYPHYHPQYHPHYHPSKQHPHDATFRNHQSGLLAIIYILFRAIYIYLLQERKKSLTVPNSFFFANCYTRSQWVFF